ncbi:MAG: hypothetical protein ACR2LN_00950 [Candidatus Levyibacteriota bacterium]
MTGITKYDSAAFMLDATAKMLQGKAYDVSELMPPHMPLSVFRGLAGVFNTLPNEQKIKLSVALSTHAAVKASRLGDIKEEEIAQEIIAKYPKKEYPAIAIGSANGALVHLYASLGIPWLPQTNLVLINREEDIEPDDMVRDATWGEEHAKILLKNNPKIQLHQMNDPSQDRFMAIKMSYLRLKFAALPDAYRTFIEENLQPNGEIIIIDCTSQWPVTKINDRHYFQVGGFGGITIDEYLHGGPRVKEFLKKYNSRRDSFHVPKMTGEYIEAEWGFEQKLLTDLTALAKRKKYSVKKISFKDPEDPTIPITEFYTWWYKKLGRPTNKLLLESFLLLDPYWAIRTGCIPFWSVFTGTPSYEAIKGFLKTQSYEYIYMTLFSNIVEAIGVPKRAEWEGLLTRAKKNHALIGVDMKKFPFDLTTPYVFFSEIQEKIPFFYSLPKPLPFASFENWMEKKSYPTFQYSKVYTPK